MHPVPSVPLPCPSQPASPEHPHRALGRPGTHGAAPQGSVWPGLIPAGFSPLHLLPQAVSAALPIELVVTLLSVMSRVLRVCQPQPRVVSDRPALACPFPLCPVLSTTLLFTLSTGRRGEFSVSEASLRSRGGTKARCPPPPGGSGAGL